MIDAGFVVAEHDKGSYAKYYLANSYYAALKSSVKMPLGKKIVHNLEM